MSVEAFEAIKDDIDYYVTSNQEADFAEDETLYDELMMEHSGDEGRSQRS